MVAVLMNSWALFLGVCLLMLGNGLQGSLIGVRATIEGFDTDVMGFVMSAYFAGFLLGSWITPGLLRRVGHVRVFAAFASLVSAAFIIYAVLVHPVAWALMRFVVGIGFASIYIVAESWLNDASTNESRGQTLSLYVIVQMVGIITGQFLLNVADPAGYDLFILISVVVSVSFAPILLSVSPAPVFGTSDRMSFADLFRASPLGCIGMFLLGGIYSAMFGMAAIYGAGIGLDVGAISIFVAVMYGGGLLLQFPVGRLSDGMDRRVVIFGCTVIGTLACIFGAVTAGGFVVALVAAFALGGTANPLYALLIAHTNDHLDNRQMASASSGLIFINGVGAMLGPICVGFLMRVFGPAGFFWYIALLMGAIAAYASYRATRRPAPEAGSLTPYSPMPQRATYVTAVTAQEWALETEAEAEADARAE